MTGDQAGSKLTRDQATLETLGVIFAACIGLLLSGLCESVIVT